MDKHEKQQVRPLSKVEREMLKITAEYTPAQLKELLSQSHISHKEEPNVNLGKPGELTLGVVSDTHLNNKQCDIDSLHRFYEDADKEGVDAFIHSGDLTDGINVYKGQIYELLNLSFDDQLRFAEKEYPKIDGVTTYRISGNHDEARLKQGGINFGEALGHLRPDMKHLGFYNAKLKLNDFDIELQHGGGSTPYAASYHLQRYLERVPQKENIDIYSLGHYHRELEMLYRGGLAMLPGAFLKENLLAKRFKLGNNISGKVIKVVRDDDGAIKFQSTLYKYH